MLNGFLDIEASVSGSSDEEIEGPETDCKSTAKTHNVKTDVGMKVPNFIDDEEANLGGGQDFEDEDEESSEDDLDSDGECRFPFKFLLLELTHYMTAGQRFDTCSTTRGSNDSEPAGLDYRMASVVRRYEARASEGERDGRQEGETGDGRQEERETEALASLAERAMERAMRMPTTQDPKFWVVSVYVSPVGSLSCRQGSDNGTRDIQKGTVEETFWAMHNRLHERPQLASSVFMPPRSDNWICIESTSHKNAVELCIDLSTVHQPPTVLFVPEAERVQWVTWGPTTGAAHQVSVLGPDKEEVRAQGPKSRQETSKIRQ